jgi:hypothetical protein
MQAACWAQPILKEIDDAGTGDRCVDAQIGRRTDAYKQRSRGVDPHHLAVALKLPARQGPAASTGPDQAS